MEEMAQVSFASLEEIEIPTTEETHAAPAWSGMRALMLAVLEDGIHSLRSSVGLVRAEAEHWITSQERRYVFSFAVICETLGLDPSAVRRSVIGLVNMKRTRGRLLRRNRPNVRRNGAMQIRTTAPGFRDIHRPMPPPVGTVRSGSPNLSPRSGLIPAAEFASLKGE